MTGALRELGGIDVDIATTDADGPGANLTAADLPMDAGVVHLFRRDSGESQKYSRGLTQWLNVHARDYDVIQIHSTWNHAIFAARRAARRAGVPYIIRPCGNLSDYTWQKSKWKKRVYWWLRRAENNIRYAAGFHVTSNDERAEVLRLGVTVPVDVIPLGIGNDAWQTPVEPNWLREQCPQAGNRPLLLFLSRMHPKKGITEFLLPALARMKSDAFLAIVGGEDNHAPGFIRHVHSEIDRLGLGQKVMLLGPVPPQRAGKAAFDGADVFVLPSLSENFGIVVAEAMARGKPVVVTTGVQFAEHVTAASAAGTFIKPGVRELAECLDLWLSNPSRRTVAGESGRQYIQNQFTWQRTAKRLADLYERVSGGQSCPQNRGAHCRA